jgi:protein involved in polysaccharide export with SLBB domain
MNQRRYWLIVGIWAAAVGAASAQLSTFPTPPPLPQENPAPAQTPAPEPGPAPATPNGPSSGGSTGSAQHPVGAGSITSMAALDDKTQLQDGDTISFRVIEDRDDPVQRMVTDTGDVDFPYIGPVKVEGRTCHAVAVDVKKLLEVNYYKQATVIIALDTIVGQNNDTKPKDLAWVMGEVRQVGPLELPEHQTETVSQLIIRAGGPGDFGDLHKVKLIHRTSDATGSLPDMKTKNYEIVDVKSIFNGKPSPDPVVQAGDYIIVPKKIVNFGN